MAYLKTLEVAFAKPMKKIKQHFASELAKSNIPAAFKEEVDDLASNKDVKKLKSIVANNDLDKPLRDYAKRTLDDLLHALSEHQRSMEEAAGNLDKVYLLTGKNTKEGYLKALDTIGLRARRVLRDIGLSKIKYDDDYDDPKKLVHYGLTFTGWSLDKFKVVDFTKPLKEEFASLRPQLNVRKWNAEKGYMYEITIDITIKTISETRK